MILIMVIILTQFVEFLEKLAGFHANCIFLSMCPLNQLKQTLINYQNLISISFDVLNLRLSVHSMI